METQAFVIIALFVLSFGLVSGRLQRTIITPPMTFVVFGLLLSARFLGIIELEIEDEAIRTLAELTLVLVLFTDALRIDLKLMRREYQLSLRLLGIGLPLTIVFGAIVAATMFKSLSFWEAALLAAVLAPTDAALGQAVISLPRVPVRIRQTLNVESGLNDGIALPVVLLLAALASSASAVGEPGYWITFVASQLIFGPLIGIAVGFFGGKLVEKGTHTRWMNHTFEQISSLALALLAFALAEVVGGNGFIAAFVAGLTIGNTTRSIAGPLHEFAEAEGQLLTLFTFLLYGAVMVVPALERINSTIIVYSILSLTVIRMLPVAFSLIGMKLRPLTILFLGWFGPRGVASILFGLLVLERHDIVGHEEIFMAVVVVVFVSVFAHGLSALPAANYYADHAKSLPNQNIPELHPITEMPIRYHHHHHNHKLREKRQ